MKFKTTKTALVTAIESVQPAARSRSTLPVLECVLLKAVKDRLIVKATNLDLTIWDSIPVETEEPGAIALPAQRFHSVIKSLSGEVNIEVKGPKAVIQSGNIEIKLNGLDADEFPKDPDLGDSEPVTIPNLQDKLKSVIFAASTDQTRFQLNGAYLGDAACGTDGRRLALATLEESVPEMIIPTEAVREIVKTSGAITFTRNGHQARFDGGTRTVITKLVEGRFPSYQQVIPKDKGNSVKLPVKEVARISRMLRLVNDDDQKVILLEWANGKLKLSCESAVGSAEESLDVESDMDGFVKVNADFLVDGLMASGAEEIECWFKDELNPLVFEAAGFQYVLMPVRIQNAGSMMN